eukprot:gene9598-17248_t
MAQRMRELSDRAAFLAELRCRVLEREVEAKRGLLDEAQQEAELARQRRDGAETELQRMREEAMRLGAGLW